MDQNDEQGAHMNNVVVTRGCVAIVEAPLPDFLHHPPPGAKSIEPAVLDLARALHRHHPDTLAHSWRMAGLTIFLYVRLLAPGKPRVPLHDLHSAALLHDVGKMSVPDELLSAPRALTDEERRRMRHHAGNGGRMLQSLRGPLRALACSIAITHHEGWNGSGYPAGTAREALPLHCQVAAMMDVFDALASPRAYKPGWSLKRLVDLFTRESGKQFDPRLIARMQPFWTSLYAEHRRLLRFTLAEDPSFSRHAPQSNGALRGGFPR